MSVLTSDELGVMGSALSQAAGWTDVEKWPMEKQMAAAHMRDLVRIIHRLEDLLSVGKDET